MLIGLSAQADPVAPDAGQTLREMQIQPDLQQKKSETLPLPPEADTPVTPSATNEQKIAIKAIHVAGSKVFAARELEEVVAYLIGAEHTFSELEAGVNHITAYYRQRGYIVARAYLPAQDIKDGALTINVMEGVLGRIDLRNQAGVSDKVINRYLSSIQPGEALQVASVNEAIVLINDTSGIGATRASLQPGASVGTTDLLIETNPTKAMSSGFELDNYGNRYTGEYRLGGSLALNSPLKLGDLLNLRALTSDGNMSYARIAYQLPLGANGLKLGGAYAETRYGLGKEFAYLKSSGTAGSTSLYATYPFIRGQLSNLSGTLTLESKDLVDKTDAPITKITKQVQLINAGLAGNRQDMLWGGGMTSVDTSLVAGKLGMDDVSLLMDKYSAKTNGEFIKLAYSISRLQRLTDETTLSLAVSGQQSNKNLNSSEKFSLGGANGVRAYPQGEGSGDEGWLVNLELRRQLIEKIHGLLFYDAGSVTVSHTPYSTTPNYRDIAGVGLGMNAQYWGLQFKTSVAWRTSGGKSQSEPASINRQPRLWGQLSGQF